MFVASTALFGTVQLLKYLCRSLQIDVGMLSDACLAMQSVGSSPAAQRWAAKPDAKAAVQLLPAEPDKGGVSRSEGSSPTAAGQKGSAWTGQISHAVLTGAAKSPQPQTSPSAKGIAQRPASAQPSSQTPRTQQ